MKKSLCLSLVAANLLFVGCSNSSPNTEIAVGALKGPTAMGMVKMMSEEHPNLSFEILASPDQITPKLIKGEIDIAAVPANLASVLYHNTQENMQVLAINTLGVLYIVENGHTVTHIEDLKGKTIYSSGKGATPEYALNYLLEQNGLADDVTIEWKSEHSECVVALQNDPTGVAMLPEPFVTTSTLSTDTIRVALDLTDEWADTGASSQLITGVIVGNATFIKDNKEAVDTFLDAYEASTDYVTTHLEESAKLVGTYDIVPESVAALAIPNCNITYIDGNEMQTALSGYLEVLFEQNPKAIGGQLPSDAFYYVP